VTAIVIACHILRCNVLRRHTGSRQAGRRARQPLVLLGCVLATAYFAYHANYGTHGLEARRRLIEREGILAQDITVLETVRRRLRQDVAALATDPPAPDITDEIARAVLGFVRAGDTVIIDRPDRRDH
jgi:cell division protein FtsB